MKVTKKVINVLTYGIGNDPPETGGIFGIKNCGVVSKVILEKKKEVFKCACRYVPDVDFLNKCIEEWENNKISFAGMFHTHFAGVKTLSDTDEKYICNIMKCMPDSVSVLYFPVWVLPEKILVGYRAEKVENGIHISNEEVIII